MERTFASTYVSMIPKGSKISSLNAELSFIGDISNQGHSFNIETQVLSSSEHVELINGFLSHLPIKLEMLIAYLTAKLRIWVTEKCSRFFSHPLRKTPSYKEKVKAPLDRHMSIENCNHALRPPLFSRTLLFKIMTKTYFQGAQLLRKTKAHLGFPQQGPRKAEELSLSDRKILSALGAMM